MPTRIRSLLLPLLGVALLPALLLPGAASAASLPKLSLNISSSKIEVSGATQSGAVNVVTTVTGKKEAGAILFRINPGVTLAELEAFLKTKKSKDPNAAGAYGSLVFDAAAAPGHPSEVQTSLTAGQYLALATPGQGPPKFFTSFTVTTAQSPASLPKAAAVIRSIEFDFRGPTTLRDGQVVGFENAGYLVHMDMAFPVKSKAAANQVAKALETGKEGGLKNLITGAPVSFQGPVSHGAYQQETITARPGWYVQVCFMETQEGVAHTALGMERVIRITG